MTTFFFPHLWHSVQEAFEKVDKVLREQMDI